MNSSVRPRRADAARNLERLLRAGEELFEESGAAMPFEQVARLADVGKGTLYRHFPTREHLLAALLASRFEGLAATARELSQGSAPLDAYRRWLVAFDQMPSGYRGLRTVLMDALGDDASVIAVACEPMKTEFDAILVAAQDAGLVRSGIAARDLLTVVAALPDTLRGDAQRHPWLAILIDGTLTEAGRRQEAGRS
ncbi:TetR/AcrR family transcriptional regulator [Promicromonospora sukumoe]|uniref:TetR/AcrR family transcriptional regulator n=1 Tax=Promicromonospora sukumoe TaxID=88382 RepID=UPI000363A19B|nr:TetR/AcrR family transcriptional regulator [Promicromonospora sukumoe]